MCLPRCRTGDRAKAVRDREADKIKKLLNDLNELKQEIANTQDEQQKLNQTKAALHDDMSALLLAAAAQDVGQKLLDLVATDGATEVSGALDEESQSAPLLAGLAKCISGAMDGVGAISTGNPNDLVNYMQTPAKSIIECGGAGQSGEGGESGDPFGELVNGAVEEFELAQVLRDALGSGNGAAEAEYIQEHLSELGVFIPEEEMQKAKGYLGLVEKWVEDLNKISALDSRIETDLFALADAYLALQALQQDLKKAGCSSANSGN
jgi:hypothetical protein